MRVETSRQSLWHRLIRPVLWPLLLAQLILILLGLVVVLICWWLMPADASWSLTLWLLLAFLVGSSLNVAIFLMLVSQRLSRHERRMSSGLQRLNESIAPHVTTTDTTGKGAPQAPEGLDTLADGVERQVSQWRTELSQAQYAEQRLLEELESVKGRLKRIETERERAKESDRLKSHFLSHLQQALSPSLEALDASLDTSPERPDWLVTLRDRVANASALLDTLDESPHPSSEPGARVLIVDDGPVNLMLARQVLEKEGLQVVTASSGSEALARLSEMPIDLVFMDIFMADMDGVETCRVWREQEARQSDGNRNVVVALTANAGEADRQRFQQAGMDDYLAKPYRPQDILETVRHWLPGVLSDSDATS